jgi:hypothetical protein
MFSNFFKRSMTVPFSPDRFLLIEDRSEVHLPPAFTCPLSDPTNRKQKRHPC